MDFSDKIIIFCIIFLILAILSVIFNCYKFNKKSELFKNKRKEKFELPQEATEETSETSETSETPKIPEIPQKPKSFFDDDRKQKLEKIKKEPFTNNNIEEAVEEFFNKSDEKFMEYMQANKELFNNNKFIEKMSQKISEKLTNKKNKKN